MAVAVQMDFEVDLCKPVHLIRMDVPFFTGDKNAHRFHVKLKRNGCAITPSTVTVSGYMVRADNRTVRWSGVANGCDIYLTMPQECYEVPGRFQLLIKVASGDLVGTALWVEGYMLEITTGDVVDADGETATVVLTVDENGDATITGAIMTVDEEGNATLTGVTVGESNDATIV